MLVSGREVSGTAKLPLSSSRACTEPKGIAHGERHGVEPAHTSHSLGVERGVRAEDVRRRLLHDQRQHVCTLRDVEGYRVLL